MRHDQVIEWIACAKIRAWVVVALLQHLVEAEHPMSKSTEAAKERVRRQVQKIYGAQERSPLAPSATTVDAASTKRNDEMPVVDTKPVSVKHATPEAVGGEFLSGEAFHGAARPNVVSKDFTTADCSNEDAQFSAGLGRQSRGKEEGEAGGGSAM